MDMGGSSLPVHLVEEMYHILLGDDTLTLLGVEMSYKTNIVNNKLRLIRMEEWPQ